jgi:hypothetical protein
MKAIDRRLRRLQERIAPQENEEVVRLVALLRERRRRRAEANGEPFEVRPCEALTDDQKRPLSIAEILRSGRRRDAALNESPTKVASDILIAPVALPRALQAPEPAALGTEASSGSRIA